MDLERLLRISRLLIRPETIDQRRRGDRPTALDRKDRQEGLGTAPADLHRAAIDCHGQIAKDSNLKHEGRGLPCRHTETATLQSFADANKGEVRMTVSDATPPVAA